MHAYGPLAPRALQPIGCCHVRSIIIAQKQCILECLRNCHDGVVRKLEMTGEHVFFLAPAYGSDPSCDIVSVVHHMLWRTLIELVGNFDVTRT